MLKPIKNSPLKIFFLSFIFIYIFELYICHKFKDENKNIDTIVLAARDMYLPVCFMEIVWLSTCCSKIKSCPTGLEIQI